MSLCKECVTGMKHEGTPEGKWENIGGVESYVATPVTDYPKDKVLLFLSDVFGPQLVNAQLMADDFARNGFKTIIPDYLNGDPFPPDAMDPGRNFDIPKWLAKHTEAQTRPPLDKVINALKETGVKNFGATGYCLGGRYALDLAFDALITATAIAHPALLAVPEDFVKYAAMSKAPLLINSCVDEQFPPESRAKADELLGGGKFAPGYAHEHWANCTHGFATRADIKDAEAKAGKEGAFKATVEWMIKYM